MNRRLIVVLAALLLLPVLSVFAQDDMMTPSVTVGDQLVLDGTVTIDSVVSDGPGFIVIHRDNEGSFAEVIGYAPVGPGENVNVRVEIDTAMATPVLYAMLHSDTGEVGVYEFGEVEGADGPVAVDGEVVTPAFGIQMLEASDQFVDGSVTIDSVILDEAGFVVIHAGDAESFGEVIGFAPVEAGMSTEIMVELTGEATAVLWPMLHTDTGEVGVYEFGEVEGADGPVAVDGQVATFPIWTVPNLRVQNQTVLPGDAMSSDEMNLFMTAESALSDGPGWLVVHVATTDDEGNQTFGAVAGFAPLQDGLNEDVVVELDQATPVLYPMLHVDTGEEAVYEFGEVEGADGPVVIDGEVETFPIEAAPFITYEGTLDGNMLTVAEAAIDGPGWLVIHADNDGAPGPVLGQTRLNVGLNEDVVVELDEMNMTDQVFPMLHYDTGETGVYEFGQVEGADGPVTVNGDVVVGPLTPETMSE